MFVLDRKSSLQIPEMTDVIIFCQKRENYIRFDSIQEEYYGTI